MSGGEDDDGVNWVGVSARELAHLDGSDVPVYDGRGGFPPPGAGRSWDHRGMRHSHPPLDCPNPRMMGSFRGFYRCPACGYKVRLAGEARMRDVREAAYGAADVLMEAVFCALGQIRDQFRR